jgi:hypothetical protein
MKARREQAIGSKSSGGWKRDIETQTRNVRFVPKPEVTSQTHTLA